jgi:hypothetical protein
MEISFWILAFLEKHELRSSTEIVGERDVDSLKRKNMKNRGLRPSMLGHTFNSSTWEAEAGGSWVQGQSGLRSEFQDNLACIVRSCLKINT